MTETNSRGILWKGGGAKETDGGDGRALEREVGKEEGKFRAFE